MVSIRDEESSSSCQEAQWGDCVILSTADSNSSSITNPLFFAVPHSFHQLTFFPQQVLTLLVEEKKFPIILPGAVYFLCASTAVQGLGQTR